MDEEEVPKEAILALMERSSATVIGPDDKFIIHVDDPNTPRSIMNGMADTFTRVFGKDRSVVLVGETVHINVVRGKNEQD